MPTNRETYPIKFSGGLITNMSPLQQGMEMPGSARILRNFEPSIEGGYKRILGYDKYDLLDPLFFKSRIHPDYQIEDIFKVNSKNDRWEHNFRFKKPHGEFSETRISFHISEDDRCLATWQFLHT